MQEIPSILASKVSEPEWLGFSELLCDLYQFVVLGSLICLHKLAYRRQFDSLNTHLEQLI